MLSNLKVGARLGAGFGLIVLLLVAVCAIGYARLWVMEAKIESLGKGDMALLGVIATMQQSAAAQAVLVRDITGHEDLRIQKQAQKDLADAQKTFADAAELAQTLIGRHADMDSRMKDLRAAADRVDKSTVAVLGLVKNAEFDEARTAVYEQLRPLQAELAQKLAGIFELTTASGRNVTEANIKDAANARRLMLILSLAAVAIGVAVAVRVTRSIVDPLADAAYVADEVAAGNLTARVTVRGRDQVAHLLTALNNMSERLANTVTTIRAEADRVARAANALHAESQSVSEHSEQQTSRILEVGTAIEEMGVAVAEVSNGADGVSAAAAETRQLTEDGSRSMQKNLAAVDTIVGAAGESSAVIEQLSGSIGQIFRVATTIKEIADQTNLLALNAAIEAARAGEQGRGFAVVADEVRKLAERTGSSTQEIAQMLEGISRKTEQAVASMNTVRREVEEGAAHTRAIGDKLDKILAAAVRAAESASGIAQATREQTRASETTAQNVARISSLAEENTEAVRAAAFASNELAASAEELKRAVAAFRCTA